MRLLIDECVPRKANPSSPTAVTNAKPFETQDSVARRKGAGFDFSG